MTKYILHGGYTRADNESNRAFYREVLRDVPDGGTVLLVYFASRKDDISAVFTQQIADFKSAANGKNIRYVLATEKDFLSQLGQSDAVYLHGGSTRKLIDKLRTYSDLGQHFEGKTVAGSSAGAYALARYGTSHSEEVVREGLGLVPLRVVCHFESADLPPSPASIALLKNIAADLEMVYLRDFEWKVFIEQVATAKI